jgi:hypothetical protein
MPLTNYTELQAAIADFLLRSDLTATIPTFIALAEAELAARVRHWRMETRATVTASTQYVDPPSGWMETVRIGITTAEGPKPLRLLSQYDMMERRNGNAGITGQPEGYAFTDGKFELYPAPDGSYTLEVLYIKRPDALSSNLPSNWILSYFPAAYLYGALKHSAPYLQEDARIAVWGQMFEAELATIERDAMARHSGTGLRMTIGGRR